MADGESLKPKLSGDSICDTDLNSSKNEHRLEVSVAKNSIPVISFRVVYNKKNYPVSLPKNELVSTLKVELQKSTGVPPAMQKLMFKGLMKDDQSLEDLKVTNGSRLMLVGSRMEEIISVVTNTDAQAVSVDDSNTATPKEPICRLQQHKKVLDKYGKPEDAMAGIRNCSDPLPPVPLTGMCNKTGGKVRLTFKLEDDQLWIGTKERTDKIPMGSIKAIVSEPIEGHEEYHLVGIQLGPTEASRYWIYWVPAQYVNAIKTTILGPAFF